MNYQRLIEQHQKDLETLNNQRRWWLWASSIVCAGIVFLIFGWDWLSDLKSKSLWWVIVSLMLIISVNWWYWTMRVIRIIVTYQAIEYNFLKIILDDINHIKTDIKEFYDQTIDILK